ncbi:Putative protein-RELATED SEQUENCE [Arachis hypogaea]|nr:Putative protein-RELATED SEQUENCE [Arachis hypogaea]
MDDLTSDCQLNQGEVDYEFESNKVPEPLSVVDDQFVPNVGMTFTTLEDAGKFYRNYAKTAGFSTRVRSTNRKENEIKNQLITCSREGKWKSKISPTEKANPTAGLNCPARIYIHTLKDVGAWIISKINLFDAASVVHSNFSQYQGHVMNYQFRVPAAGDNSLGV